MQQKLLDTEHRVYLLRIAWKIVGVEELIPIWERVHFPTFPPKKPHFHFWGFVPSLTPRLLFFSSYGSLETSAPYVIISYSGEIQLVWNYYDFTFSTSTGKMDSSHFSGTEEVNWKIQKKDNATKISLVKCFEFTQLSILWLVILDLIFAQIWEIFSEKIHSWGVYSYVYHGVGGHWKQNQSSAKMWFRFFFLAQFRFQFRHWPPRNSTHAGKGLKKLEPAKAYVRPEFSAGKSENKILVSTIKIVF